MTTAIEVHVTAPSAEKAAEIGRALVQEGLAACVNIVPGVRSIYQWEGKIADDAEVLCLIKTRADLYDRLERRVRELHPYEVPEIIAFEVLAGSRPYLDWLKRSTAP